MDQTKLYELKQRAKSALGITQIQLNRKAKNNAGSADNSVKIDSMKNKNKINKFKTSVTKPQSNIANRIKKRNTSEFDFMSKYDGKENYSYHQRSERGTTSGYGIDEFHPFMLSANSKNIININNKLISDLNEQINILNEKKRAKKFFYKQTVNLQKLNDYIIYEYTKNKMEFNKMNHKKNTTSFRLPIQYRRMGNHGKKEDLIPISILPKINLEDILILHNSNARNTVSKNKVHNYYLKNNIKYKKSQINPHNNKEYSDEIALKYINIY
jgi:hypothetical protein